jgi:hypothetical protein
VIDIEVVFAKVPDGEGGSIAFSINGLKKITELAFQAASTQPPDKVKQPAIH